MIRNKYAQWLSLNKVILIILALVLFVFILSLSGNKNPFISVQTDCEYNPLNTNCICDEWKTTEGYRCYINGLGDTERGDWELAFYGVYAGYPTELYAYKNTIVSFDEGRILILPSQDCDLVQTKQCIKGHKR